MTPAAALLVAVLAAAQDVRPPPPTGRERALIEDAKDGALASHDLLTASLIASGVPDAALARRVAQAKAALAPAVARARTVEEPRARGRVLLAALHQQLLRRYEAEASSVALALESGTFNCLSSAVWMAVASQGLFEDSRAVFTRTHAYLRVKAQGRWYDVETTSPQGFDPPKEGRYDVDRIRKLSADGLKGQTDAEILADLRKPEELPLLALIAGLYANGGVMKMREGDVRGATVAFDRGARVAPPGMREQLSSWRAAMLDSSARKLLSERRPEDARTLLLLALEGTTGDARGRLRHNLGVVALELADRALKEKRPAEAVGHFEEALEYGLRGEDVKSALAAARAAVAEATGDASACAGAPKERAQCLAELSLSATGRGKTDAAMLHARAAAALDAQSPVVRRALFYAHGKSAEAALARGACAQVRAATREAERHAAVAGHKDYEGERVVAGCLAQQGSRAYEAKRWDEAAGLFRQAVATYPRDASLRENLGTAAMAHSVALANAARCDEARPLVAEARRHLPKVGKDADQVMATCWSRRAYELGQKRRFAEAVAASRLGLEHAPKDDVLRDNLDAYLQGWAHSLLEKRDCDEARALVPELSGKRLAAARAEVQRVCGKR